MCFDDCPFRDQAELEISPQGDRQFARQGGDHHAPHALRLTFGAPVEPLAQGRVRLVLEPHPGGLDHDGAHETVAGLGDALAASALTAVIRAGCEADIAGDLASVGEPPVIDLPGENGGRGRTDAVQAQELVTLALRGGPPCREAEEPETDCRAEYRASDHFTVV